MFGAEGTGRLVSGMFPILVCPRQLLQNRSSWLDMLYCCVR